MKKPVSKASAYPAPKELVEYNEQKKMADDILDSKSFFHSDDDGLACAIRDLHKFLAANLGAVTKRDLERGLNKMKDEILQELKGNMATVQEQLAAQKAQLTEITSNIDGVTDSVATLTQSFTGIAGDVAQLKALVEKLQNDPSAGWTAENQATLDEIQSITGGLKTKTDKAKTDVEAAKQAAADLDAATEAGGSGDGGQTPPAP